MFNVGDNVKVVSKDCLNGRTGVVKEIEGMVLPVEVQLEGWPWWTPFEIDELQLND